MHEENVNMHRLCNLVLSLFYHRCEKTLELIRLVWLEFHRLTQFLQRWELALEGMAYNIWCHSAKFLVILFKWLNLLLQVGKLIEKICVLTDSFGLIWLICLFRFIFLLCFLTTIRFSFTCILQIWCLFSISLGCCNLNFESSFSCFWSWCLRIVVLRATVCNWSFYFFGSFWRRACSITFGFLIRFNFLSRFWAPLRCFNRDFHSFLSLTCLYRWCCTFIARNYIDSRRLNRRCRNCRLVWHLLW